MEAELDARLAIAEARFQALFSEVSRAAKAGAFRPQDLARLHLSRSVQTEVEQAIRDEQQDTLADFLQSQEGQQTVNTARRKPPPPPPPYPPPPSLLPPSPSRLAEEEEKKIIARMTNEAKAAVLGKDREIRLLKQQLERSREALEACVHWRETAAQYSTILITSLGSLLDESRTIPLRAQEKESLGRLCEALQTHLTRGGNNLLPEKLRTAVQRSMSRHTCSFHPASLGDFFLLGGGSDNGEDEKAKAADSATIPTFQCLGVKEEDAAERLFSLYLLVQRESQPTSTPTPVAPQTFVGRRAYLLCGFMLDLFSSRLSMQMVEGAFNKAAMSSARGRQKFSSRLEMNDFVAAMGIIADASADASASPAPNSVSAPANSFLPAGIETNPRLHSLLCSLALAAEPLLSNEPLRKQWIDALSPILSTAVFSKLARAQPLLYAAYRRSKCYGLVGKPDPHASGELSTYVEGETLGSRSRQMARALGVPADTALSSSRRALAASLRSHPSSPTSPSSPSSSSSPPSPSSSSRPSLPARFLASVSTFEAFCVDSYICPLLARAATARRIAQHVHKLDASDSFRGFVASLGFLAFVVSSAHSSRSASSAVAARQGFEEAMDKIIALLDAGVFC